MGVQVKRKVCDPPLGWIYGFPKVMPKNDMTEDELREWLVSEGYPKDKAVNLAWIRYWYTE